MWNNLKLNIKKMCAQIGVKTVEIDVQENVEEDVEENAVIDVLMLSQDGDEGSVREGAEKIAEEIVGEIVGGDVHSIKISK